MIADDSTREKMIAQHRSAQPNILFILADDLGWGDLACFGNPLVKTPNIDAMTASGIAFTQFYVPAPACSPSRAGFISGRFPARDGIHRMIRTNDSFEKTGQEGWLDHGLPTLPRILRNAEYRTAHFGKWHIGDGPDAPEVSEYGFDETRILCQGNGPSFGIRANHPRGTEFIVDETLRFIREDPSTPFYCQLWLRDVHGALDPKAHAMERYSHLKPYGMGDKYRGAAEIYFGAVTEMDRQIGRLLDGLERLGKADDTLVIFTSDNGPAGNLNPSSVHHNLVGSVGPFRGRKCSVYEGGIRMPMVVRWPAGAPSGRVDNDTVWGGVDFLRTFASLAGADLPEGLDDDGEDVGDALQGRGHERVRPLIWEWRSGVTPMMQYIHRSPALAIRNRKWKLLMNPDGSRVELYDIVAESMEVNNRADENRDLCTRLAQELLAWNSSLPGPPPSPTAGRNDYPWPTPTPPPEQEPSQ